MTDLHDELNRISLLQGRNLIDGTRIEGGDEPWPAPLPEPITEDPDYPDYKESQEPVASPIDPVPWPPARPEPEPVSDRVGAFADFLQGMELMVHDNAAMYRARAVELTSEERSRIVRVVLGALRRTLEEQYAEVAGPPRKRRKNLGSGLKAVESAIGNDAGVRDAHALPAPPSPRKRRGRPKKLRQALDGTLVPQ